MLSPEQTAAYITASVFALAAGYERFRSNKTIKKSETESDTLSDAKAYQQRGDLMAKMATEYKELYEKEANEHIKTRDFWHTKAGEHQVAISLCQDRILELQGRPDLTDIVNCIKMQSESIKELGEGIKQILLHITNDKH